MNNLTPAGFQPFSQIFQNVHEIHELPIDRSKISRIYKRRNPIKRLDYVIEPCHCKCPLHGMNFPMHSHEISFFQGFLQGDQGCLCC